MNDTAPLSLLREKFVGAMSNAASTVNIVTTDGPMGRSGVTVSAMASVSADTPRPTLLVCVHNQSPTAQKIIDNGVFCVNVLRDDQGYISDAFAGRHRETLGDKFDCADWQEMPSGAPRVVDPLVAFDCSVANHHRVGTHHVIFGQVGDIFVAEKGSPLIYAKRSYGAAFPIGNTVQPARIEHANITVPDIDASIEFLRCVEPEFEVMHDARGASGSRWVHIGTPRGYFALEEPHEPTPDADLKRRYADYGVNHIGLVVADVDAVAARLIQNGYKEGYISERHPARIRRYFNDAAGMEWELVEYLTDDAAARFSYD